MQRVAVVDYGMSNLASVVKALEYVVHSNTKINVTSDPDVIRTSDKVVFPGQGAAADCMQALARTELIDAIKEVIKNKPFLGICMGMQVLLNHSEENQGTPCLGLINGEVKRFTSAAQTESRQPRLKIPHMGWNTIYQEQAHPLWTNIPQNSYFYFVHSYYAWLPTNQHVAGTTHYGLPFTSALAWNNVFALQCHPEKSARAGLQLLNNFLQWNGHSC